MVFSVWPVRQAGLDRPRRLHYDPPMKTWIDPQCDRSGWPAGPWDNEPDKAQWTDRTTGLVCLLVRHPQHGHLCGYVGVPPGHPLHGKQYDAVLPDDMHPHGGLTFSDFCQEGPPESSICHVPEPGQEDRLWWLGFDCAHSDDFMPGMAATLTRIGGRPIPGIYKDVSFVQRECARLARRLV